MKRQLALKLSGGRHKLKPECILSTIIRPAEVGYQIWPFPFKDEHTLVTERKVIVRL